MGIQGLSSGWKGSWENYDGEGERRRWGVGNVLICSMDHFPKGHGEEKDKRASFESWRHSYLYF